jgi:hypothetical protein
MCVDKTEAASALVMLRIQLSLIMSSHLVLFNVFVYLHVYIRTHQQYDMLLLYY